MRACDTTGCCAKSMVGNVFPTRHAELKPCALPFIMTACRNQTSGPTVAKDAGDRIKKSMRCSLAIWQKHRACNRDSGRSLRITGTKDTSQGPKVATPRPLTTANNQAASVRA